jgi:hypothetical protein
VSSRRKVNLQYFSWSTMIAALRVPIALLEAPISRHLNTLPRQCCAQLRWASSLLGSTPIADW